MLIDVIEADAPLTWLALNGRLDTDGAQRIETQFAALTVARQQDAMLDMSGVSYIASQGIRILVSTAKALHRQRHRLVLFAPQPLVADVLRIAGIDQVLAIADTAEQAQALLGG